MTHPTIQQRKVAQILYQANVLGGELEQRIMDTSTGELRNLLCDANIYFLQMFDKLQEAMKKS